MENSILLAFNALINLTKTTPGDVFIKRTPLLVFTR